MGPLGAARVKQRAEPELALFLAGVRVWSESAHCHELEVDTSRIGLQTILSAVMKQVRVVDLTIADPPMEGRNQRRFPQAQYHSD